MILVLFRESVPSCVFVEIDVMDTATALRLKHSRHRIYTTDELEALFCSSVRCKECQKIGGLDRIGFAVRNCAASVCINPRLYIGGIRVRLVNNRSKIL